MLKNIKLLEKYNNFKNLSIFIPAYVIPIATLPNILARGCILLRRTCCDKIEHRVRVYMFDSCVSVASSSHIT